MRAVRRGLLVVALAALVSAFIRLRGKGGYPPVGGGWRELESPEFR